MKFTHHFTFNLTETQINTFKHLNGTGFTRCFEDKLVPLKWSCMFNQELFFFFFVCVLLWSFYSSPGLSVHAPSAFFSLFFFKLFIFFPRIPGGCLAFAGLREHRVPIASEKGFGWPRRTPERPQNLWKHHQRLQVGYICSLEVILLFCYLPWPEEPLTWGMLYKRSVQFAANYRVSLPDQSGRPQQSWHPLTSLVWSYSHWEPDDSSKVCVCARAYACATRVILGQSLVNSSRSITSVFWMKLGRWRVAVWLRTEMSHCISLHHFIIGFIVITVAV